VRVSERERSAISSRAAAVGLAPRAYLRQAGLGHRLVARRRHEDRRALAEVSRVSNNLRQLRRVALESGDEEMAFELDRVHEELQELADRIVGTFAGGG
jgi:hypothetical protein